ncbi:MAG: hypothetical protein JRE45_18925 [Deltaproteobacteria bacterium]|nr:hypothetical protein [Deltaproteobacteria bacterium]
MASGKSILSNRLDSQGEEWALLQERIREVGVQELSLFSGMNDEEIDACLAKSVRIDCHKGDALIMKGNPAKNLYAVIRENLEVKSGDDGSVGRGRDWGDRVLSDFAADDGRGCGDR